MTVRVPAPAADALPLPLHWCFRCRCLAGPPTQVFEIEGGKEFCGRCLCPAADHYRPPQAAPEWSTDGDGVWL